MNNLLEIKVCGINDKFSMRYVMSTSTKKNNVGYIDTDSLNNVLFSKRDIYMITNVLSGSYIINNKMYIKMKLRHYWSQLENTEILNYMSEYSFFVDMKISTKTNYFFKKKIS